MKSEDPFAGVWELDPATLDYQIGRPGRRATYTIEAVATGLKFTLEGEDGEGKPIRFVYEGPLDGSPQPIPGGDGSLQLILHRPDERSIESILLRGGQVADRWTRELAPDGQSMKVVQHVTGPGGGVLLNTSIYRRSHA